MNILGIIVARPGLDPDPDNDTLKEVLERCLRRAQARSRQQCDPLLESQIKHIWRISEALLIASSLRDAKGAILACDLTSLKWVKGLGHKLHDLDRDNTYNFRGKWFGLIVSGGEDPWKVEQDAQEILRIFNDAGMVPLPQAFVHLPTLESRGHLRLAVDLAEMIASQSEWTGRAVQSAAA